VRGGERGERGGSQTDIIVDEGHDSRERIGRYEHCRVAKLDDHLSIVFKGTEHHMVLFLPQSQERREEGGREEREGGKTSSKAFSISDCSS
jgi:hypothetical protein